MLKNLLVSNVNKWSTYKVGNFTRGKITLVKDYGVILEIADGVTGFILNENLKKSLDEKQANQVFIKKEPLILIIASQVIFCRILDIDYEREILDLIEVAETTDQVK